jgi:hypothetical protein
MAKKPTIEEVKDKHALSLIGIDGVEGVGIGDENNHPVIKVYVSKQPGSFGSRIPEQLEGYPVSLEYSGKFEALQS